MSSSRPWVPYLALVMLAGLLVAAFLARGAGRAVIGLSPEPDTARAPADGAVPEAVADIIALEFDRDGHTCAVEGGQWREITPPPGHGGWVMVSTDGETLSPTMFVVRLPPEVEPGPYRVCATDVDLRTLCTGLTVSQS